MSVGKKIYQERDNNTRLGDISYQLSRIYAVLERIAGPDIELEPDDFNERFKRKYGNKRD